jgi:hypothetical protein
MATPTNLPATAVAGEILTAAYVNNLRGAFRTLQVVQYTTNTYTTFLGTYGASTITGAITPQSATSKILVQVFVNGCVRGAESAANALNLQLTRGSTQIEEVQNWGLTNTTLLQIGTVTMNYLDSPATTSSTTYAVNGKNSAGAITTVGVQFGSTTSTLILTEISA